METFRIEVYEDNYPYEEITELLHESYKEHLNAGREYLAATQTIEDTKRRLDGRLCVVAYNEKDKAIATMSCKRIVKAPGEKRKWYEDENMAYFGQMAVHPDYRKTKIIVQLRARINEVEWVKNADSLLGDTSENATELVKGYVAMGYQIVDVVSWETTNYYSYIFRKPVKGRQFNGGYVKLRFCLSNILYRIRVSKCGKERFPKKRY